MRLELERLAAGVEQLCPIEAEATRNCGAVVAIDVRAELGHVGAAGRALLGGSAPGSSRLRKGSTRQRGEGKCAAQTNDAMHSSLPCHESVSDLPMSGRVSR